MTTSMAIFDQLPITIRRTTVHQCLLTEDILSSHVIDLDKDTISKMLPEQDRPLWRRLIDHFTQLLKYLIRNSKTLTNKFAPTLLPSNALYLHDKVKSWFKHIVVKLPGTHQLNKITDSKEIGDDDEDTSSSTTVSRKMIKSLSSIATTTRGNINQDDSDLEFFG